MKRLLPALICIIASLNTFAAWHKAEVYLSNGTVSQSEIQLPDETFAGLFKRAILVKNGNDENYLSISKISKLVLNNGITFVKYDNNGKPVLLKQITRYANVNILILETSYSPGLVETDHYIYRSNGSTTFENQPIGYDIKGSGGFNNSSPQLNIPSVNNFSYTPIGLYYSGITHNGRLYTPDATDYIYLMKGDEIVRLQSVHTYENLAKVMGDDDKANAYIKQGIASYSQLNGLVALYNADKSFGN